MKYVNLVDPKNPNWFHVAENLASGGWDLADACAGTGCSVDQIKFEMIRLGGKPSGANVVAALATNALNRIGDAEKAAAKIPLEPGPRIAEPMPPSGPIATAATRVGGSVGKSGAAAGGLSVGSVAGVALGVLVVAAGVNYARNANRFAAPGPGAPPQAAASQIPSAAPSAPTAATAAAPSGLTCTRGDAIVTQMGRSLRQVGDSVAFEDPDTRNANTLGWQAPPVSVRVDDELALASWSTHNPGRPMEVQWESGTNVGFDWGYGASSKPEYANEGRKITRLRFTGGSVRLKGGVNYGSADESFRLQWDYYCKS